MSNQDDLSRYEGGYSIRYARLRLGLLLVFFLPLAAVFAVLGFSCLFWIGEIWAEFLAGADLLETAKDFASALFFTLISAYLLFAAFQLTGEFLRNSPVAVLTKEYVEGPGFLRRKRFAWRDVEQIFVERGTLQIAQKPKGKIQEAAALLTLGMLENRIVIHPLFVEDPIDQIHSAIRYYSGKSYV